MTHPQVRPAPAFGLLKRYDDTLPRIYGYPLARCGDIGLTEELRAGEVRDRSRMLLEPLRDSFARHVMT